MGGGVELIFAIPGDVPDPPWAAGGRCCRGGPLPTPAGARAGRLQALACGRALALTAPASALGVSCPCFCPAPVAACPTPLADGSTTQIKVTKAVDGCTRKAADGDAISVHYGTLRSLLSWLPSASGVVAASWVWRRSCTLGLASWLRGCDPAATTVPRWPVYTVWSVVLLNLDGCACGLLAGAVWACRSGLTV